MLFGLTRGEIILIAWIFALVYGAGHLPRLATLLGGKPGAARREKQAGSADD